MLRTVEITVPSTKTEDVVKAIRELDGVLGLRVQRGVSMQPAGDVVSVAISNRTLHSLMHVLDAHEIGRTTASSATISEPTSLISAPQASALTRDVSEATWEEIELMIGKESNMTVNGLAVMWIAGALAALGLATSALHYVIAAMVIVPGFEPIVRIALGAITGSKAWRRGLADTLQGYAVLILGAMGTGLVMRWLEITPAYLPAGVLISYWTTISAPSLLVSALAGFAGAVLIAIHRSILTAGVMIALALIPTAAIAGLGVAAGDLGLAGQGLLRWGIDVGLVVGTAALVFGWKLARTYRRRTVL
jgi:hypothetical protein